MTEVTPPSAQVRLGTGTPRVWISPTVLLGIATQLRLPTVAPESDLHAQPTREPLASLDALTMSAVVAMWAIAGLIRRAIRRDAGG
jgi:hypothetical protein